MAMAKEPIMQVEGLTKRFQDYTAVSDVSFSVKKGEIVGLLGPNGAGKTTTIQMLLGLVTPTAGTIRVFGKSLATHREEILGRMNFSSTYTHLPWRLTVKENLEIIGHLYGVANIKEKVQIAIKRLGLEEIMHKQTGELSAGWTTRVNLARTFLNDPAIILLDEPTASLDPESAHDVRREIMAAKRTLDTTILWTSHNMAEVEAVCDRVIFLQKGKVIAEDTPMGLARRVKSCVVQFLFEDDPQEAVRATASYGWKWDTSERFSSVSLAEQDIAQLLQVLGQKKVRYTDIAIEKPTLEDFFLDISKQKA